MSKLSAPWLPVFGTGAPGASVPHNAAYFDTSTTPYTPYIYASGAWHKFGGFGSGTNATSIQGVAVSATAPSPGQVLEYNSTNNDWEPTTPAAGTTPTIVQNACVVEANMTTGITLGAAPTNGNLLIALLTDQTSFPTANTGWTLIGSNSALHDGYGVFWKVAGASESATQTPTNSAHQGSISMYEIANGASSSLSAFTDLTASNSVTENAFSQKPSSALIVGAAVNRALVNTTSITGTGVTRDAQTTAVNRGVDNFHVTNPAQGNNAVTVTYAASEGLVFVACAIG